MASKLHKPLPRTILYISTQTELGGAQQSLLDIVRTLDAARFRPLVVVSGEGELVRRLRELHIETEVVPFSTPLPFSRFLNPMLWLRNCAALVRVANLVKRQNVSLIHCNDGASLYLIGLAKIVHDVPVVFHVRWFERGARRALVYIGAALWVDKFVTNSFAVQRYVQKSLPRSEREVTTVHNAVDVQRFHPSLPKNALREELHAPAQRGIVGQPIIGQAIIGQAIIGQSIIGMIGRFIGWKKHGLVIKAAMLLRAEGITPMFCLVGAAQLQDFTPDAEPIHNQLLDLVRSEGFEGQIHLLGYRKDIERVIAGLDILICPSDNEPFGRVVIEAMACGVPVIASESGGIPEIITHGEDGLLVPVNDERAIAEAIKRLLRDKQLSKRICINGRTTVEKRFSLKHLKEGIERVYAEMLQVEN